MFFCPNGGHLALIHIRATKLVYKLPKDTSMDEILSIKAGTLFPTLTQEDRLLIGTVKQLNDKYRQ
jgi:hypothetical protein